ncbi:MAG: MMPL family transporter [Paracoccaceae bacterium]
MTDGLTRMFAALLRMPRVLGGLLALVTLLAGWQATQLRIDVDLSGLIGPETAEAQALRAYNARFESLRNEEVLLLSSASFADETALAAFESIILELQFVDDVERVISLASLPAPGRQGAWLGGPELAALAPAERLTLMRTENPLAAQLVSADLRHMVVAVVPAEGAGGESWAREVLAAAENDAGITVQAVGISAVQRAIASELIKDLQVLTPAAIVICFVLALAFFRDWRSVVAITMPPITGVLWFFGWMGAAGIGLDPVMGALPVLLIVLTFSDCIHVHHAATATPGGDRVQAIARAMAQTAPAVVLTSLTTIIALASLWLTQSPSLNTMALAGTGGMILCLLSALFLMPAAMLALGLPRAVHRRAPFGFVVPLTQRALAVPRLVAGVSVVVLLVLLALQTRSQIGFRYVDYLPRGADVTEALQVMERSGLGSDRMILVVERDPAAPSARVEAAAEAIWGEPGARWAASESGQAMLARMVSRDEGAHALPLQLAIATGDIRADTALEVLEHRLDAAGLAGATQLVGAGHALLAEGPNIVASLRMGLYATIGLITVLIGVLYRSWALAFVSLVANLIPILGVEVWLVLIGRELTIMNMIALTLAFGIAVDDTLHFLNRFRLATGATEARLRAALVEAGPPMTATTVILVGGLIVTLFSTLPGFAVYGGLIGLAVGLALLADLFLLPGMIRWLFR